MTQSIHPPNKFTTTPLFWDCDCDGDYIRSKLQFKCDACGITLDDDPPDSRLNEVLDAGLPLPVDPRDIEVLGMAEAIAITRSAQ